MSDGNSMSQHLSSAGSCSAASTGNNDMPDWLKLLLLCAQGHFVPQLLGKGLLHGGLLAFMATAAGGDSLAERKHSSPEHGHGSSGDPVEDYAAAKLALQAIHEAQVLHNSVHAGNMVRSPDGTGIWFVDFSDCMPMPQSPDEAREAAEAELLLLRVQLENR